MGGGLATAVPRSHNETAKENGGWSRWPIWHEAEVRVVRHFSSGPAAISRCNVLHSIFEAASTLRRLREVHALEEGLEAGVGAEGVEKEGVAYKGHQTIAVIRGFL